MMWAVLFLVVLLSAADAYPDGPPPDACVHMTPGHVPNPPGAHADSPYSVDILGGVYNYSANQEIRVKISGGAYKGFFIQARAADGSSTDPLGIFVYPPKSTEIRDCSGFNSSAIAHTNSNQKRGKTFTWIAPEEFYDPIVFVATVVRNYANYWVQLPSAELAGIPPVDLCDPNPCRHKGRCSNKEDGFKCKCVNGYKGKTCEKNACKPNPCKKNRRCKRTRRGKAKCIRK